MKASRTATQSVLTKLSAMRITLSKEEQAILDRIVLTAPVEGDEVVAHQMAPKPTPKPAGKALPAVTPDADEVVAHAMNPKPAGRMDLQVSSRVAGIKITLNSETGEYVQK